MSQLKLFVTVACLSLFAAQSAFAQPGWRHPHRYYYGYAPPPVYAYPPVVVAPPPVVYGPPAYIPPPVYAPPVYGPPVYGYGAIGPRGHVGFGYSSPGFGVYLGR